MNVISMTAFMMHRSQRQCQFHRMLVIQTAFIGDLILTTPLLRAAKKSFPQISIECVVLPQTANLITNNPHVDHIIPYDKRRTESSLRDFLALVKTLRRRKYDAALIPHRSWRSASLVLLAGIPTRIGFDASSASILYTHRVAYRKNFHETERNLNLLSPFGVHAMDPAPEIFCTHTDEQKALDFLTRHTDSDAQSLFGIAAGSVWPTKRWIPQRFAEVADRLIKEKKGTVILFGGPEDRTLCNRISAMMDRTPLIAAGHFSLKESAALIAKCRVFLSNDTGLMHLAAAMHVPVVALFGATIPAFGFAPLGDGHTIVEAKLPCRPCGAHGTKKCREGTFACMKMIRSQEVYEAVLKYV